MNIHIESDDLGIANADAFIPAAPAIPDAVVGGGFIMLRRNSVGRLRAPRCPYEHGSLESAETEAVRMAHLNPGTEYVVLQVAARHLVVAGA